MFFPFIGLVVSNSIIYYFKMEPEFHGKLENVEKYPLKYVFLINEKVVNDNDENGFQFTCVK